ncbi:hypothetical protein P7K49_020699 [Saguinus oedipus]|uniref:Uncharacterized protein n=1 Tax=Saguinus oedipus TaxID=9490 RepID=A0ABQ9V1C9_SAGOE|nr:hypothetical protein P7K49_020699 [Saguinus oedipus]
MGLCPERVAVGASGCGCGEGGAAHLAGRRPLAPLPQLLQVRGSGLLPYGPEWNSRGGVGSLHLPPTPKAALDPLRVPQPYQVPKSSVSCPTHYSSSEPASLRLRETLASALAAPAWEDVSLAVLGLGIDLSPLGTSAQLGCGLQSRWQHPPPSVSPWGPHLTCPRLCSLLHLSHAHFPLEPQTGSGLNHHGASGGWTSSGAKMRGSVLLTVCRGPPG